MTNEELLKIVDEFAAAIASGEVQRIELATGDILMALSDRVSVQSASAVMILVKRQEVLQRHIVAVDARLDQVEAHVSDLEAAAMHEHEATR